MAEQVPSIGRVVHFVYGDRHVPAIITDPTFAKAEFGPPSAALTVFPVGETPFTTVAEGDEACAPATWHWPEYVPAKG